VWCDGVVAVIAALTGSEVRTAARRWFALQAVAGIGWWALVWTVEPVRTATLGGWDPALVAPPDLALFVAGSAAATWTGRWRWAAVVAAWTIGVTAALVGYSLVTGRAGLGAVLMGGCSVASATAALALRLGRVPTDWFFVGPFRFREAGDASPRRHLARSLAQVAVFWSILLVLLPIAGAWAERRMGLDVAALRAGSVRWAGAILFAAASTVALWACAAMSLRGAGTPLPAATASRLVIAGPYRVVRNPMALTGAVQTIGIGLVLGSWIVLAAALAGGVVWDVVIRPVEEADLAARFGEPYRQYRARVRCWIPTWGRGR
jgi:protein-S-isoprenylcysteine O-methyltransferase Ste14